MTKEQLIQQLKVLVADQVGLAEEEITLESSFEDDFQVDSLDVVELLMAVEEEFDIEIVDEVAEKFVTFKDAVEYIADRVKCTE